MDPFDLGNFPLGVAGGELIRSASSGAVTSSYTFRTDLTPAPGGAYWPEIFGVPGTP